VPAPIEDLAGDREEGFTRMTLDHARKIDRRKILYVEDNRVVLTAYRNRLLQEGFHVESARDGLQAMKILSRFVPDLVLLDLMLPKFNGVEVLKFMQADARLKQVPVVILSAKSANEGVQDGVLTQASKRFLKDLCTFPTLLQAIHEVLANCPVSQSVNAVRASERASR
jgi:DNA-binding response OmpR family regulator